MAAVVSPAASSSQGIALLPVFAFMLLLPLVTSTQFKVGGYMGWAVPSDPNAAWYNQWAAKMRFRIGDSVLFVYPSDKDSVLEVSKEDYEACNVAAPMARYTDGKSVIVFNHSGPHYFISGVEDNCRKDEKMVVVVMAERSKQAQPPSLVPSPPPAPSASPSLPPPSLPPSSPPPSPPTPPVSESTPSPPPSGGEGPNPHHGSQPPAPNAASSVAVHAIGMIAASLGLFMLVF